MFRDIHHIAVICSDYQVSKDFYVNKLGLSIIKEVYREERNSYKLDLALHDRYVMELFSFPDPPERPSFPETCGLRHLAFSVEDVKETAAVLEEKGIPVEEIRVDPITNKRFTFFQDPDQLPIEIYEC
ncbi:SMU1112c/YaeR family gloxylase I-like metalloprotein [Gracilibacillus lacisalsi]|uniref:SMU1112c/YaeR family gloxylase I-like metalloprotein n=1 Tax=Gracilibacillus lacisalsi TaxID=393087 RepID=UPI000360B3F4|nr:VOC family protein [Gracilibacillus lacisalsi]